MSHLVLLCLFLSIARIEEATSARIIATGVPGGYSHNFVFERLGRALKSRGHDYVQFVSTNEKSKFERKLSHESASVRYFDPGVPQEEFDRLMEETATHGPFQAARNFAAVSYRVCDRFVTDPEVLHVFEHSHVDVLLFDTAFICPVLLAEKFHIPHKVAVSNTGFMDPLYSHTFGFSVPLASVPLARTPFGASMDFGQRIINSLIYGFSIFVYGIAQREYQQPFYEAHNGQRGSLAESARDSVLLLQGAFGLDLLRDLPPNVKFVGALLVQDPVPLPESYQKWMDNATEGVIVASFGTIFRTKNEENVVLLEAFKKLPYKVLWKLSAGQRDGIPEDLPPNVRIEDWIPQSDLLAHRNTKVLLTHCGMNSMMEGIFNEVPMFGFPKFADQFDNCKKIAFSGMGKTTHKSKFTSDQLAYMITEIASNSSYKDHVRSVKSIVKDAGGVSETVKWIEYVLRNGVEHLVPKYAFEPFWIRWMLDVLSFEIASLMCMLYLIKCLCSLCICHSGPLHKKKD